MSDLGELSLAVTADTRQYTTSMNKATKLAGVAAGALTAVGAAAAAGAAALGAAAVDMVSELAAVGDEAAKSAQQIGISSEAYQELGHAMELSGKNIDTLKKGLLRLARNANDASEGIKAPAEAFEQLGISATNTDGTLKNVEQLLPELADAFSGMDGSLKKAALAQEIFGKAGSEMIPFLNAGSAGIAEMRQEARDLGIVLSNETTKQSELFNDTVDRLNKQVNGFKNLIGSALLPIMTNVAQAFLDMGQAAFKSGKAQELAKEGTRLLTESLANMAELLVKMSPVLAGLATGVRVAFNAMQIWGNGATIIASALQALGATVAEFVTGTLSGFIGGAAEAAEILGQKGLAGKLREGEKAVAGFANKFGEMRSGLLDGIKTDLADIATDFGDVGSAIDDLVSGNLEAGLKSSLIEIRDRIQKLGESTLTMGDDAEKGFGKLAKSADAAKVSIVKLQSAMAAAMSAVSSANVAGNVADAEQFSEDFFPTGDFKEPAKESGGQTADVQTSESVSIMGVFTEGLTGAATGLFSLAGGLGMFGTMLGNVVTQSEGFQEVMQMIQDLFQEVFGEVVAAAMEVIVAALEPIALLLEAIAPLMDAFATIIRVVLVPLEILFKAVKPLADVIGGIVKAIKIAVNSIRVFIANIGRKKSNKAYLDSDGNIIDPKGKIGPTSRGPQRVITTPDHSADTVENREEQARQERIAAEEEATESVTDLGDAAREAAEEILNVPKIFQANLRRVAATAQSPIPINGFENAISTNVENTNGGSIVINGNVIVNSDDADEFEENLRRRRLMASGSTRANLATTAFETI